MATDVEASASQMDAWMVTKDGSGEGVFTRALSLVGEKLRRKAMSSDHAQRFQCMYGGVPLVGLESAAGNKLEKVVCKGDPLSMLVKVGCLSVLGVVHFTRFVGPGHERPSACRSLLRSLLAPSCTLTSYSFFLSVV
jgi:hypothetical protein